MPTAPVVASLCLRWGHLMRKSSRAKICHPCIPQLHVHTKSCSKKKKSAKVGRLSVLLVASFLPGETEEQGRKNLSNVKE